MTDSDSSEKSKFIIYLNANNLYGWTMSQYLPYGGFTWLSQKEIDKFDVNSIGENSSDGYILEVDLEYPNKLHDFHNGYPLAPEKLEISDDMLPKFCIDIAKKYGIKVGDVKELVPSLGNESKYVVHYRNLQLSLSLGMKLTEVHKVLKSNQSDWLKKYIDFNTDKRKEAVNSFEKNSVKLRINSVYGKTMEDLRRRINVRLVNNGKDYKKYVSKPSFVSQKIFSKIFLAIHEIKTSFST